MDIIFTVVTFAVGVLCGMAGYRAALKRDPAKLEAWAKKVKAASDAAEDRFR